MKKFSKFTKKDIDEKLTNKSIKILGEYINIHTKTNWQCLICNYIWSVTPDNIFSKNSKCPNCNGRTLNNKIVDERLIDTKIKRISNYIDSISKIEFQCLKCNNIWQTEPRFILNMGSGCPQCNIPGYNEKLILNIFNENKINFIPQFSIKKINNDYPAYRLDFYIPDKLIAIEYNGKQHYEPTRFGSKYTEKDFDKQVQRDNYVKNICQANNIELIEIDGRKIYDKILADFINKLLIKLRG